MSSVVLSRLPRPLAARLRSAKRVVSQLHWIDEAEIIADLSTRRLGRAGPVLVDVGANYGSVTSRFLEMGWSVVAYEPDPANREEFERRIGDRPGVQLSAAAVSDQPAESLSLFTSPVSIGISTLTPFHESHEPTAKVKVVTLAEDLHVRGVRNVDFLKVDIEGYDYFALKGFDWGYSPRFVLYEFENRKTEPLGHSLEISSAFMANQGYHLVYSIWEPIVEYGTQHRWRGLFETPPSDVALCWGNVLCFRDEEDAVNCMEQYGSRLRRAFVDLRRG